MQPTVRHTPPAAQAEHAALVVAFEARDLGRADQDRAAALVAACTGCAELLADLGTIRAAVAALPAPARTRDFRLTDAEAARHRPSFRNRVLGWLAAPRSSLRPVAAGLAALGMAGLVLTALPGSPGPAFNAAVPSPASARGGEGAAAQAASADPGRLALPMASPAAASAAPAIGVEMAPEGSAPAATQEPYAQPGDAPPCVAPEGAAPDACTTTKDGGLAAAGTPREGAAVTRPDEMNTGGAEPQAPNDPTAATAPGSTPYAVDESVPAQALSPRDDRTVPLVLSLTLLGAGVAAFLLGLLARRALR